jgi:starch phosphorylase
MVFLEDYDINVARYIVQGVDVWLNTPLRPMEASGTSGMKVAANGGLNVSILDGWWAEGYEPLVGWGIGSGETYDDLEYQNAVESQALYELLEKEIVPLFYDRGPDNIPRGWTERMKAAMGRLAPVFNTNRMVRQYAETFYAPAAKRLDELIGEDLVRAKELSAWRSRLQESFANIRIESVSDNMETVGGARVGRDIRVEAVVELSGLQPQDIQVQLYYGYLDADGQLSEGEPLSMQQVGSPDNHHAQYAVEMPCARSGMTGYTVRILPEHPMIPDTREMAMIRWA